MGSSLAVFQHFRNVEDVIAVFKMCILLRVAGGQILVKILNVYYRDLTLPAYGFRSCPGDHSDRVQRGLSFPETKLGGG